MAQETSKNDAKVNWKLLIFGLVGSAMFVMMLMLSHAIGKTQGKLECLSRSLTEFKETADPLLEQTEALKQQVIDQHGDQARILLDRMFRMADEALQRAEQEFEEADPARGGP